MCDKELIVKRFARSYESYNKLAIVQMEIAKKLADELSNHLENPKKGIEIGAGTGFLTRWLVELFPNCSWTTNDIVQQSEMYMPQGVDFLCGDGEFVQLPNYQDVIVSASTVQWFSNLSNFIERAKGNLNEGGVLAISTFGKDNFLEITKTTGDTLNYLSESELREVFEGFDILFFDQWQQKMTFKTPIEVLQHIKQTGVNAVSSVGWTNSRLKQFCADYIDFFEQPTLTFNPIIIIARKNG